MSDKKKIKRHIPFLQRIKPDADKKVRQKKYLTFLDATKAYRHHLHLNGKLKRDTELRIRNLEKHFGATRLIDITNEKAQEWLSTFENASAGTLRRNLIVLKAILNMAYRNDWLYKQMRMAKIADAKARTTHIEPRDIMRVVEQAETEFGPIYAFGILFLCDTGARLNEALALQWRDFGDEWIELGAHGTDTGKSLPRSIPTSPRLLAFMEKHGMKPTASDKGSDPVFQSLIGMMKMRSYVDQLRIVLKGVCKRLVLADGPDTRIHDLRHTFAYQCAISGADLADIKDMLGHKDVNMTARYRGFVKKRALEIVKEAMRNEHRPRKAIKGSTHDLAHRLSNFDGQHRFEGAARLFASSADGQRADAYADWEVAKPDRTLDTDPRIWRGRTGYRETKWGDERPDRPKKNIGDHVERPADAPERAELPRINLETDGERKIDDAQAGEMVS